MKASNYESNRYTGGKQEHPRRMDARLGRIYGGKKVPKEAKARALSAKMGKKTRAAVEKM